jgi:hypothetical protein
MTAVVCKLSKEREHLNQIFTRYLEFCNMKEDYLKYAKFSYDYQKHTIKVEINNYKEIEFDIYDFADWDKQKHSNNVCYSDR